MTTFLELAKSLGVEYKDGSSMLLAHGVLANRLFTQNLFSVDEIEPEMRRSFLL
jgi:shikimate 5-dehydrogenase